MRRRGGFSDQNRGRRGCAWSGNAMTCEHAYMNSIWILRRLLQWDGHSNLATESWRSKHMGRGTYSLLHACVAKQSPAAAPRLAAFAAVLCVKAASHTHEMYSRQRARLGGLLPFVGASPDDAVFEEVEEEREREKQRERGVYSTHTWPSRLRFVPRFRA